jgi:tetratricopeptide (TPR) repeat protein
MSRTALAGGLAVWVVVLLMAAGGVRAQAAPTGTRADVSDDQEARDLFKLGKQAFEESRYERALKYFKEAYELSHRAVLLSNIGTALDRLRRDAEALEAYKSYLEQVPEAANRGLIEERVQVIESAMPKPTAALPSVPSPAETAQAEVERTPAPSPLVEQHGNSVPVPESRSLTSRWWFWAGIGTLAAAAAAVVGVAASSSGGGAVMQGPALSDAATRVREL